MYPLSFMLGPHFSHTYVGPVNSARVSVISYVYLSSCVLEGLVSLVCSIPSVTIFLHHFVKGSLSPDGKVLMETSHLGLIVLRSFIHFTLSNCGFLYLFLSSAGGSFSEDG